MEHIYKEIPKGLNFLQNTVTYLYIAYRIVVNLDKTCI